MTTKFQKKVEDFVCENCGITVHGNGYTNHCPHCLWSKHVDVHPGDRAATCLGMMEPIRVEGTSPNYKIVHRCTHCGHVARITVDAADDMGAVVQLAKEPRE